MRKTFLILVLVGAASGCMSKIRPTTVALPSTPEAGKCWRECDATTTMCTGNCRGGLFAYWAVQRCGEMCADSRDKCLRTCPGATDTGVPQQN
jgi:hypothetical protein